MRAHILPSKRKYRELRFLSASLVLKLRNELWRIKHPRSRAVVWSRNRDFRKANLKNIEFLINTLTWAQLQKILPGMKNAGNGTDLLRQRKSQDSDWIHRREAKSSPRSARNRLTAADPVAAWDCHGKISESQFIWSMNYAFNTHSFSCEQRKFIIRKWSIWHK